jgi:hypothetical protein
LNFSGALWGLKSFVLVSNSFENNSALNEEGASDVYSGGVIILL